MGLMDMFGKKSQLVDCHTFLSNIPGKLSGVPQTSPEGVVSVWFVPDDKKHLLNRNKTANPNGMMELKIKVNQQYRPQFLWALEGMAGQTAYATGVLINDDSKGGKAEIYPLDMIYAPLPPDRYPAWFKDIQGNLKDPNAVAVYRIAAASDASTSNKPPQSEESRVGQASFPYPSKPNFPKIKIDFEVRKTVDWKAEFQMNNDTLKQRITLDLGTASLKEDGPGVFVGDFVAYWGNE